MKVAILGHFLTEKQLKENFPGGKYLPVCLIKFIISLFPKKFRLVSNFDILGKAQGCVVLVLLTSKQMMNSPKEKVRKIILDSILYCQNELKCNLVMLGALTAPITSAGLWLREQPEVKLAITTGNTYTAAITIQAAEKAMELAGLDEKNLNLAVVGSAGVIGEAVVKHFNEKGVHLILVERNMEKFERLKPSLKGNNYELTDDIKNIIKADVVITATSHPEALITGDMLKKNAIVVDVAEPSDVVANINEVRPDVICIDGGRVRWDKVGLGADLGLPKNVGFACMTEGMLQSLEEDKNDYIGSVKMEHLQETIQWAEKWGFGLADFTSFNKPIDLEKFKRIKTEEL